MPNNLQKRDILSINNLAPQELSKKVVNAINLISYTAKPEDAVIDNVVNIDDLDKKINDRKLRFYKIEELSHEDAFPRREVFENVISSLNNTNFNFIYYISGTKHGASIYIGIAENENMTDSEDLTVNNFAKNVLKPSFEGNFYGSTLTNLENSKIEEEIFEPIRQSKRRSCFTGVPSIAENDSMDKADFQGIDRLINALSGKIYQMIIVSEPVKKLEIEGIKKRVYQVYNDLYKESKVTESYGYNESIGASKSKGKNKNVTVNKGTSKTKSDGSSYSPSSGGWGDNHNNSETNTENKNIGKDYSGSKETINKEVQEMLDYIDEELLDRIKLGYNKGLFKTSSYLLAEDRATLEMVENSALALFNGNKSSFNPLKINYFDEEKIDTRKMISNFKNYTTKSSLIKKDDHNLLNLFSIPISQNDNIGLSTYMTPKELSLISGLPVSEIAGISLREKVNFGLNIPSVKNIKEPLNLGSIIQNGKELEKNPIILDKRDLNKHIFIAGVTGAGKTTTCHKLLTESELPFWVIEPAKTEYRVLLNDKKHKDLIIFTLGNEKISPFRLNPFELLEDESITAHVDMLKATFEASFHMEAAMPQLLEAAIYDCYEKYGWDIDDDTNEYCENPFNQNGLYFPTFSDLIISLKNVTGKQGFDKRLENDYIGSLVSRIHGLIVGSKGQMLNCKKSIGFDKLLEQKVIFELEDIKSGTDKSLIMGFILTRLSETIKKKHEQKPDFKHLTLIEEAHRLLAKFEAGDSMNKKHGVEVFTDLLAEVRKYGESLIIVDQIPNKLTPEVLKNTNTKIIHKLFARDDKESVGDTMGMNDEQKNYLSNLKTGEAVVFSEGWNKPVLSKIKMMSNTSSKGVKKEKVIEMGRKLAFELKNDFHPELSFIDGHTFDNIDKIVQYKKDKKVFLKKYDEFRDELKKAFEEVNTIASTKWIKKDKLPDKEVKSKRKSLFNEKIAVKKKHITKSMLKMKNTNSNNAVIEILKLYYGETFIGKYKDKISNLKDLTDCLSENKCIYDIYSQNKGIFNK